MHLLERHVNYIGRGINAFPQVPPHRLRVGIWPSITSLPVVVTAVVQITYKPCRCRHCILGHLPQCFSFFVNFLIPRSYFTSRTRNKDQKIEQLFHFLGDIHELYGEHFYACHSHNVSRFNHHSVALVLLYNMSLERNFSIERFQVMQHQNSRKSQHNHVVYLHVPCLTMG